MTQLPGEDGIPNTFDDRILIAGGGTSVVLSGEEPITIDSEIYLPIGSEPKGEKREALKENFQRGGNRNA